MMEVSYCLFLAYRSYYSTDKLLPSKPPFSRMPFVLTPFARTTSQVHHLPPHQIRSLAVPPSSCTSPSLPLHIQPHILAFPLPQRTPLPHKYFVQVSLNPSLPSPTPSFSIISAAIPPTLNPTHLPPPPPADDRPS
ncbi:hypothetical protein N7G274_005390 [Stereocaulon virgatum]|uniref:Uncharacterized protein n=1 Tax=Stereocaulon virgatum TaxID=373712 RepID=A0ABR4A878_9LECA